MQSLEDPFKRQKNIQDQSFESLLLEGLDSVDTFNQMELPNYYNKVEVLFEQMKELEKNTKTIQQLKTNMSMLTKIVDHQEVKLEGLYENL